MVTYFVFYSKGGLSETYHLILLGIRMNSFPDIVSENELENINQTSCEIDRGGCYQPLDLQIDGRPLCHRKIPTVHGLKVRNYQIA